MCSNNGVRGNHEWHYHFQPNPMDCHKPSNALIPCAIADIAEFLRAYHSTHSYPVRAIHCWMIKDGDDIKLAVACAPHKDKPKLVEVIAGVIHPEYRYTQSRLLSQTIGQLRALRTYDLAYSWSDPPSTMFRASSWYHAGRFDRGTMQPNATGLDIYWWPLKRGSKWQNA